MVGWLDSSGNITKSVNWFWQHFILCFLVQEIDGSFCQCTYVHKSFIMCSASIQFILCTVFIIVRSSKIIVIFAKVSLSLNFRSDWVGYSFSLCSHSTPTYNIWDQNLSRKSRLSEKFDPSFWRLKLLKINKVYKIEPY